MRAGVKNSGYELGLQLSTAHKARRNPGQQGNLLAESYTGFIKNFRLRRRAQPERMRGRRKIEDEKPQESAGHQDEQRHHGRPGRSGVNLRQRRNQHVQNAVNHQKPKSALIPGQIHGPDSSRFPRA